MNHPLSFAIAYALLFFLVWWTGGCAIVEVRTADAPPKIGVYPFGVKIERGDADAVTVDATSIGAIADVNCGIFGLGLVKSSCAVMDPRSCGIAIVHPDKNTDRDLLERVSGSSQAECLHRKEKP